MSSKKPERGTKLESIDSEKWRSMTEKEREDFLKSHGISCEIIEAESDSEMDYKQAQKELAEVIASLTDPDNGPRRA